MFQLKNVKAKLYIHTNKKSLAEIKVNDVLVNVTDLSEYIVQLPEGEYDVVISGKLVSYNGAPIAILNNVFNNENGVRLTLNEKGFFLGNLRTKVAEATDLPKDLFIRRKVYPVIARNDDEYMIVRYANLHQHTEYSLLDGMIRVGDLAKKSEYACAITDHGNMHGFNEFYKEMKKLGKKPIIGCEVYIETPGGLPRSIYNTATDDLDDRMFDNEKEPKSTLAGEHLILLAENNKGLNNLFKLVTQASENFYRKPHVSWENLEKYHDGLIATSACIASPLGKSIKEMIKCEDAKNLGDVYKHNKKIAETFINEMIRIFGRDNFYLELQNHHFEMEKRIMDRVKEYAKKYKLKTTVGIDAHYLNAEDADAHQMWLCKQTKQTISSEKKMSFSGDGYYVHTSDEVLDLFSDDIESLDNTLDIADRCNVTLDDEGYHLPIFPLPQGYESAGEYLRYLCAQGMKALPINKEDRKQYSDRLKYELSVIEQMGWETYFLVVQDFIAYARDNDVKNHLERYFPSKYYNHADIPETMIKDYEIYVGPGRGSAAGSLVAYCLGITTVDPLKYDLLFERFLNPDRVSMPDIDTDFEDETREQVIEYCRFKYGYDHVSRVVTFGTAGAKNALRSMCTVLDLPSSFANKIAGFIPAEPGWTLDRALEEIPEFASFCKIDKDAAKVLGYAKKIEGLSVNRSLHACAVAISDKPITTYTPQLLMDNPQGEDKIWTTALQGTELEEKGLLKMDFLGLRTLGVAHAAIDYIKQTKGKDIRYDDIPLDDMNVYKFLASGQTQGVFQAESDVFTKALSGALKDIDTIKDPNIAFMRVSDCNALVRPGPNKYMGDYAKRVLDQSKIKVQHPMMKEDLDSSMGIMLYQEQVMHLVRKMAGFSAGQSDTVRKAMGKKVRDVLDEFKDAFINGSAEKGIKGCVNNGITKAIAEDVWNDMERFAGYAFNKSHAVAYSYHTVRTAWLAYYYPVEYFTAILNSYINSADDISKYINICKEKGITILPPSVNESMEGFSTDGMSIRFGLGGVRFVGSVAQEIIDKREDGYYISYEDFLYRVRPNKRVIESLIMAGALDEFAGNRNSKLSSVEEAVKLIKKIKNDEKKGKYADVFDLELELSDIDEMDDTEKLANEFYATGFYISGHPLDQYTKHKTSHNIASVNDCKSVSLLVSVKDVSIKHSKKTGNSFKTFKIEDSTGTMSAVYFDALDAEQIYDGAVVVLKGAIRTDDFGTQMIVSEIKAVK